jgi:hypothetical protein
MTEVKDLEEQGVVVEEPSWRDRHSVGCYFCGTEFDEREGVPGVRKGEGRRGGGMRYKLKVKNRFGTARKTMSITAEFVWSDREDAIGCMKLMEKAERTKFTDVSFVEFEDERPLREG